MTGQSKADSKAVAADITETYTDDNESQQPAPVDAPMTGRQAITLKRLCEQANEPQAFDGELTKKEATLAIEEMRRKIGVSR